MLGRATRTLSKEDLQEVSPSALTRKLGYILIDAVGVSKSQKNTSRQLERHPSLPLKDLLMSVVMGARDEDSLTTLASRLLSLDKVLTPKEQEKYVELSGEPLKTTASKLLNAFDEDEIDQIIGESFGGEPTPELRENTADTLAKEAVKPIFQPEVRDFILNTRKSHDQIIDNVNLDKVNFADWEDKKSQEQGDIIATFQEFLAENKDKLVDILAVIRFELGQISLLNPFSSDVNQKFKEWMFQKNAGSVQFSDEQTQWLRMIRDHIATSAHISAEDFDYSPFDSYGGLGKFYQLFGEDYEKILEELNYILIA